MRGKKSILSPLKGHAVWKYTRSFDTYQYDNIYIFNEKLSSHLP